MVLAMDEVVGNLTRALQETGMYENTIIGMTHSSRKKYGMPKKFNYK
jgi:ACT domain-containing protein